MSSDGLGSPGVAAMAAVEYTQIPHSDRQHGFRTAEPMNDINVMRPFLQQQGIDFVFLAHPAGKVGITAVIDEMPTPDGAYFADRAGSDQIMDLSRKPHIPHVVSDHQFLMIPAGQPDNRIAIRHLQCHRFFQIDGTMILQTIIRLFFVQEIRLQDQNRIGMFFFQHFPVIRIEAGFGASLFFQFTGEFCSGFLNRIGGRNQFRTQIGTMKFHRQFRTAAATDQSNFRFYILIPSKIVSIINLSASCESMDPLFYSANLMQPFNRDNPPPLSEADRFPPNG